MPRCDYCGEYVDMPFLCPYCGGRFCAQHRLPEMHECPELYRVRSLRPPEYYAPPPTRPPAEESRSPFEVIFAPPTYTPSRRVFWIGRDEILHLLAGITLVILAVGSGSLLLFLVRPLFTTLLLVIIGLAFVIHELSHKFVAQAHGLWAEFRLTPLGALLTFLSIFMPFKIIAPGAVVIAGPADVETSGKVALAGPASNIAQAIVFLALSMVFHRSDFLCGLFKAGVVVNSSLAMFNLLPFGIFDGLKVFFWSRKAWLAALISSILVWVATFFV